MGIKETSAVEDEGHCIRAAVTKSHPLTATAPSSKEDGALLRQPSKARDANAINEAQEAPRVAEDGRGQSDPLLDPLGALALGVSVAAQSRQESSTDELVERAYARAAVPSPEEQFEAAAAKWDAKKTLIMQRFSLSGTFSISRSLDVVTRTPAGHRRSTTSSRLERLEDPGREVRSEMQVLSQQEVVARLRGLNDQIAAAWRNRERVTALRCAIKVAKLLTDTSVPSFYPTLFVLVTDVMDTVGGLVWERIKDKAQMDDTGARVCTLPVHFTCADVRAEAKETCSNWFYKIGSIRELLPRIYMELAIVRCMRFLEPGPPFATLRRLSSMLRGVTDPVAAAYARVYLARQGRMVAGWRLPAHVSLQTDGTQPWSEDRKDSYMAALGELGLPVSNAASLLPQAYLLHSLRDLSLHLTRVVGGEFDALLKRVGVEKAAYLQVMQPALEFLLPCATEEATEAQLAEVVDVVGGLAAPAPAQRLLSAPPATPAPAPVALMVQQLLLSLPAPVVAVHALKLCRIVRSAADGSLPQCQNYRVLALRLCECPPVREQRLPVLTSIWKVISTYAEVVDYLTVVDALLEYILVHFTEAELQTVVKEVRRRLSRSQPTDAALAVLESIVHKVIAHLDDVHRVLSLPHFVSVLDLFYGARRVSIQRLILVAAAKVGQPLRDPTVRGLLFEMARSLHDAAADSLASEDDRRQAARAVVRFVQQVDPGPEREQHLSFLVDARAAFFNFDAVREAVIHGANGLAVAAVHQRSTRARPFAKSCIAFSEVTVPSVANTLTRLQSALASAEAARLCGLPLHAEGLVKSALQCLEDARTGADAAAASELGTAEGEEALVSVLRKMAALLIAFPGHPEHGDLFLLRGFISVVASHTWRPPGLALVSVLCGAAAALTALAHGRPYGPQPNTTSVAGADTLFAPSAQLAHEIREVMGKLFQTVLTTLESAPETVQRSRCALDAANTLIATSKVEDYSPDTYQGLLACARISHSESFYQATLQYGGIHGFPR